MGSRRAVILLDTSVLISIDDLAVPDDDYVSSAVVLAELEFGVAVAKDVVAHNRRRALVARLRATSLQWLPFTASTATFNAELMAAVHPHAPAKARARDMMIAATAYELGASLATLNVADFAHIDSLVHVIEPPRL